MSATNHTPNLKLSQFIPLDKPAWLGDYNSDMSKIDTAVHNVQTQADSMETAVEQATTAAQAATQAAQAATEAAQDAADKAQDAETTANNIAGSLAGKVNKTGDTMTGPLVLPGDPTEDNQAATKKYVDEHSGGGKYLPLTGGTLTGMLSFGRSNNGISGNVSADASLSVTTQPTGPEMNEKLNLGTIFGPTLLITSNKTLTDWSGKIICLRPDADGTNVVLDGSNHFRIKKLLAPTDPGDAATKAYVDAKAATKAYVDANAGRVSSYTNPTPGAHVSSCFGNAVVVEKLLIVDAVITTNNILNGGDILFEFSGAGSMSGDKIGGIITAVHASESAYISSDISIGFFDGDITVSYTGSSFGSSGNIYRVTVYAKLR